MTGGVRLSAAMTAAQAVPWSGFALLLCWAVAMGLRARSGAELRRARLLLAGGETAIGSGVWAPVPPRFAEWGVRLRRMARERRGWGCLPVGCAIGFLGDSVLPPIAAVLAVPLVRRVLAARIRERERERREAAVIEMCGTVAGELRAGRQPGEAVAALTGQALGPGWSAVPAAARFGGDVPKALRQAGLQEGAEGLNGVAACWRVAVDGGAGLAAGLERVAAALGAERDQRDELRAQLAGTRSTAVMLALLPVLALLMGSALGAEPLRVLLHTPGGLGCLALGGLLECAGIAWTRRIVRAAEGPGRGRK
ncbi:type II secretion system F family protein [Streptomyces griseocarneus]|uniref:type II secretion system F family protein n=1 Tax=Streptomyces griseocarneus TaxID=51201 RepID=UPI0019B9182A|nr:type II secretion system F family protein [Streptomyces griseocarneus]MBZ6473251.1 type II secretion system F family protein [Streptomyces griseocarneus]GHG60700.1 membrane protein [Streptomyces griseocarneus]